MTRDEFKRRYAHAVDFSDLDALITTERAEALAEASGQVARVINAVRHNLPQAWRQHLIEVFGLVVDEGNPYQPVKVATNAEARRG